MPQTQLTDRPALVRELRGRSGLTPEALGVLAALADDLETESGLEAWAELDLVAAVARPEHVVDAPPPAVSFARITAGLPAAARDRLVRPSWLPSPAAKRSSTWERRAEAVLGVAVFVPLLVTWTGLALAASAYGSMSRADPQETTRPFLQLWESGFDGRLQSLFQFGDIAFAAALFISALLVMAVFHASVRQRAQRTAENSDRDRAKTVGELTLLLTRAQLLLTGYRMASPQRFAAALTGGADRLGALAQNAVKAQESVERTMALVDAVATSLTDAVQRITDAVPSLGSASDVVEQAVHHGIDALTTGQAAALAAAKDAHEVTERAGAANVRAVLGVADRLDSAGGRVEDALRGLTAVQQSLAVRSDAVVDAAATAAAALQNVAGQTADSILELRRSVERWDAAAAHWEDAAARVEAGVRPGSEPAEDSAGRPGDRPAPPAWNRRTTGGGSAGPSDARPESATTTREPGPRVRDRAVSGRSGPAGERRPPAAGAGDPDSPSDLPADERRSA